jgi:hypothetical protein
MSGTVRVEALFLARPPLSRCEFLVDCYWSAIKFLRRKREVPAWSAYDGKLSVISKNAPEKLREKYFSGALKGWEQAPLLRFAGEFKYPGPASIQAVNSDGSPTVLTDDERFSLWTSTLVEEMDVAVQSYICGLSIAYPGALCCVKSAWLVGNELNEHRRCLVSKVEEAAEFLFENGIPIGSGHAERIVEWVLLQSGMVDGYSKTPAARAP